MNVKKQTDILKVRASAVNFLFYVVVGVGHIYGKNDKEKSRSKTRLRKEIN